MKTEAKLNEMIAKIEHLEGLNIEICGTWVWVSGNTKEHKEEIKAAGYRWARKKKMWYFAGTKSYGRGRYNMDEIRSMHGSEEVRHSA